LPISTDSAYAPDQQNNVAAQSQGGFDGTATRGATAWFDHKDKTGTGHWSRNRHEIPLISVKGEVPASAGTQ
jgi:hypothetical protein